MMTGPQMIIIIFIFRHHLAVAQITEKHVTRPFLPFFLQKKIFIVAIELQVLTHSILLEIICNYNWAVFGPKTTCLDMIIYTTV